MLPGAYDSAAAFTLLRCAADARRCHAGMHAQRGAAC